MVRLAWRPRQRRPARSLHQHQVVEGFQGIGLTLNFHTVYRSTYMLPLVIASLKLDASMSGTLFRSLSPGKVSSS